MKAEKKMHTAVMELSFHYILISLFTGNKKSCFLGDLLVNAKLGGNLSFSYFSFATN